MGVTIHTVTRVISSGLKTTGHSVQRSPSWGQKRGLYVPACNPPPGAERLAARYVNKHPYFGATIGRVANRIANGKFTVEGKEYQLALNNPPNSLHGGNKGFDKVLWTPEVLLNGIRFSRTSPDGEEGYPGELKVWVTYTLDGGELVINYQAQSSNTTPISLTNHAYFNLAGQDPSDGNGDASLSTGSSRQSGEVAAVPDTAFDLRKAVELGRHMQKFQLPGFDHNFCLERSEARRYCARAHHPPSGRTMEVYTTQPGIQFYTGNFLDGSLEGKGGSVYPKHSAFCLETQNWPDAVNKGLPAIPSLVPGVLNCVLAMNASYSTQPWHPFAHALLPFLQPHFPSALLRPGEEYNHTTWLKFTAA
ncbi:Aldose 1-epimerase [Chelonia mydas]|uniref:Aldose 1-epimerase n=1 Tax=Chelonia mydas TaxID=8469 RepID=M7BLG9_CHEMY|nr:Aldose 1-epimerase [Chelonia mydas]